MSEDNDGSLDVFSYCLLLISTYTYSAPVKYL